MIARLAGLLCLAFAAHAEPWSGPLFDAHLHYNVEATSVYSVDAVFGLFEKNGVGAILANSRPNDGTRALHEDAAKNKRRTQVVPFIRVYRDRDDYGTWFRNPDIHRMIVAEERRGYYRGIGEFHVYGQDADTPVVKDIVDFSVAKNLVLHAHCDEVALEILFRHNPKARVIWAHTGFTTPLARLEELFAKYPQLWGELSYRSGVSGSEKLSDNWKAVFVKYSRRFVVGSDTWINERWENYSELMTGYRVLLAQLPRETADRIAWRNAAELFGVR